MPKSSPEQNARYIRGVCIDCGAVPHSAGRPRCDRCHADQPLATIEPMEEVRRNA